VLLPLSSKKHFSIFHIVFEKADYKVERSGEMFRV
jgi:hypothetical protein